MMRRGIIAIADHTPIRARLQPKILRQTAKRPGHNEHVAGVRRSRNEEVVDERRVRASRKIRPRHVLHHDEEDGVDVRIAGGMGARPNAKDQKGRNKPRPPKTHIVRAINETDFHLTSQDLAYLAEGLPDHYSGFTTQFT